MAYSFEVGPIRPPSEAYSLLIRVTRNCPWNKCKFCYVHKGQKFELRSVDEIKKDIKAAQAITEKIEETSWMLGFNGRINMEVINRVISSNPDIYNESFISVVNWLSNGGKTVFLQDADSLIVKTSNLVEVVKFLKETFPSIERITSYARSKTAARKTVEELKELNDAGLSRLHIGLESGSDRVLEYIKKGVTAEEHIKGGRNVKESGISLSEYWMPGLGGKEMSKEHVSETTRVLNEIDPNFIRTRTLVLRRDTPLREEWESGKFKEVSEDEAVEEIKIVLEGLECNSYFASDQMVNLLNVEGQLPRDKEMMLRDIEKYQSLPFYEKLDFRLRKRLGAYLGVYGRLDRGLEDEVQEAIRAIKSESPDAVQKVDKIIANLKKLFV